MEWFHGQIILPHTPRTFTPFNIGSHLGQDPCSRITNSIHFPLGCIIFSSHAREARKAFPPRHRHHAFGFAHHLGSLSCTCITRLGILLERSQVAPDA